MNKIKSYINISLVYSVILSLLYLWGYWVSFDISILSFSLKTHDKDSAKNIERYLSNKDIGNVKILGGDRVVISNITIGSLTSIAPMSSLTNTNPVVSSSSLLSQVMTLTNSSSG